MPGDAVGGMRDALKIAAEAFRRYEQSHSDKGAEEKAARNRKFAELCEDAIEAYDVELKSDGRSASP